MPSNIRKRPDTRFLSDTNIDAIDVDLSQRHTDLTASAPGGYELASARTAIEGSGAGRSLEVACEIATGDLGILVDHGFGSGYRIRVTGVGVEFSNSNGTLATLIPPDLGGGAQGYVIAWSTEPNPLTTGFGDALRSEFLVWGGVAGLERLVWTAATHAVATVNPADTFTVGAAFSGGIMKFAYTGTISIVRVSCRFHSRVETREHFVAQSPVPDVVGIQSCEGPPMPPHLALPGALAGPQYQFAAASMKAERNRYRLLGPVWHASITLDPLLTDDLRTSYSPKVVLDVDHGYQTSMHYLARRRLPPHVEHLRVVVQWVTYKIDPEVDMSKVEIRFHTSDGPPHQFTHESHVRHQRTVDDGSGSAEGVLETLEDFVRIHRAEDGYTWLWWSMRTDEGSGSGNAAYWIRAWDVTPIVLPEGYGGIPANPWGP